MKQEDIEKAAIDYCDESAMVSDSWDVEVYKDGFQDGAKWRINSVWYPVTQIPERNKIFVAQLGEDCFDTFYDSENWESFSKGLNFVRWAYIEDLLPNKEV